MSDRPFFSIGLTTYNRVPLLREALQSVLNQSFQDFEVVIGNDYIPEPISFEMLGIHDSRVKIVNHPVNLGEVKNMNFLLKESRGKYFSWLGDDDLYGPNFLKVAYQIIQKHSPECVLTNFEILDGLISPSSTVSTVDESLIQDLTGREFVKAYFEGRNRVHVCYSVFERENLCKLGGVESLCQEAVGLYGEYILIVRMGLMKRLNYVDAPMVYYRSHEGIDFQRKPLNAVEVAGRELIHRSVAVFSSPELIDDFEQNVRAVCRLALGGYYNRASGDDTVVPIGLLRNFVDQVCDRFKEYDPPIAARAASYCRGEAKNFIRASIKSRIRSFAPGWITNQYRKLKVQQGRHR